MRQKEDSLGAKKAHKPDAMTTYAMAVSLFNTIQRPHKFKGQN